jgi:hypothetical protein
MGRASKIQPKLTDKELISLFVGYLAQNGRSGITVTAWPDETNRRSSDIDAIAGPFAIEHSSVDTIPNQRRDSAWFIQVVKALEDEFDANLPFRLSLTFPYEAIQSGQDWAGISDALRVWILNDAPKLAMGMHNVRGVAEIPFEFHVTKKSSNRNGLLFGRFAPNDHTLPNRLREKLAQRVHKLARYKNKGKNTILLVESDDIALMNDGIMWDGLMAAYPKGMPEGVDEIWFADTSIPEDIIFTDMTKAVVR